MSGLFVRTSSCELEMCCACHNLSVAIAAAVSAEPTAQAMEESAAELVESVDTGAVPDQKAFEAAVMRRVSVNDMGTQLLSATAGPF